MSDKPLAVLATAAIAAPLCLLCALGPALLATAGGGWLLGWLGGFATPLIASLVAVAGWLAWRSYRKSNAGAGPGHLPGNTSAEPVDERRRESLSPDRST